MKRPRAKAGDVLELRSGDRFGYLQYIGRHLEYGDAIVVCPRLQQRQISVASETFTGGYVTFYPARKAVAEGLVEVVAHLPAPDLPERFRRAGARIDRSVKTWIIEDGSREVVKTELSEEELRLPIASIWNHKLLVQRITEGWRPTEVGRG